MAIPFESKAGPRAGWVNIAANLAPVWLMTVAVSAEGFPGPLVSSEVGWACFGAALLAIALLALWRRLAVELLLFDLAPLVLMLLLDEVPAGYKTVFLMACAGIMTAGALLYARAQAGEQRWLIAAGVLVLVVFLSVNAADGVWLALDHSPYRACFPGCVPDTFPGVPWWSLFFRFNTG